MNISSYSPLRHCGAAASSPRKHQQAVCQYSEAKCKRCVHAVPGMSIRGQQPSTQCFALMALVKPFENMTHDHLWTREKQHETGSVMIFIIFCFKGENKLLHYVCNQVKFARSDSKVPCL